MTLVWHQFIDQQSFLIWEQFQCLNPVFFVLLTWYAGRILCVKGSKALAPQPLENFFKLDGWKQLGVCFVYAYRTLLSETGICLKASQDDQSMKSKKEENLPSGLVHVCQACLLGLCTRNFTTQWLETVGGTVQWRSYILFLYSCITSFLLPCSWSSSISRCIFLLSRRCREWTTKNRARCC